MRTVVKVLLGVAVVMPLVGQGCQIPGSDRASVSGGLPVAGATSGSAIDAVVDTSLKGAEDVQREERESDSDAETVTKDQAEVDAYASTSYELK